MLAEDFKKDVLPLSKKLMRFAGRLLQNQEEAKDVLQDIFLKLWQKRDDLQMINNIEAFAMRMTRNRCLDVIRLKNTSFFESDDYADLRLDISDKNSDTDHVENADSVEAIRRIIDRLPELQRTVIHLRDEEIMEYDEIAEITGLNINAVRVNLSRARKKVRDEVLKIQNYGITENKYTTG